MENENTLPEVDAARKAGVKAAVEAIVYVTEEPVTVAQIAAALSAGASPADEAVKQEVLQSLLALQEDYRRDDRGLEIREIAGGYKMFTKPEHHEAIRQFVKNLTPPLKLSMAALETLAAIAYRQPVTLPEIQQIRGVNAGGVLKTLLERKLITTAGRKNVVGRPILYKTTREFLVKFGLSGLAELPTLEEFGELARAALGSSAELPANLSTDAAVPPAGETTGEGSAPDTAETGSRASAPEETPAIVPPADGDS